MARISDRTRYPLDENLQNDDFLIGTDAQDNSATKSYTLEDLRTYVTSGLGESIPQVIAREFIPVVSQDGQDIAKSPIRIINGTAVTNLNVNSTGADIQIGVDFDGTGYIQIIDNEDNSFLFNYRLRDLQGRTWTASVGGVAYTGTIATDGYVIPDFSRNTTDPSQARYVGDDTHYVFRTTITRVDGSPVTLGQSTLVDAMPGFIIQGSINPIQTWVVGDVIFQNDLNVRGNTDLDGTLNVDGNTTLQEDLTVVGTTNTNGPLNINGGATFCENDNNPANDVTITCVQDGIQIGGAGDIQIDNDTTFTEPVTVDCDPSNSEQVELQCDGVVVTNNAGDTVTLNPDGLIFSNPDTTAANRNVIPNGRAGNARGQLQSLQFTVPGANGASEFYEIQSGSSAIADLLPGIGETLAGPPTNITTGRFVVATEMRDQALYVSTLQRGTDNYDPAVLLNAGVTMGTIAVEDPALTPTDRALLQTAFAGRGTNQIFFVESTNTNTFTVGDPIEGNVYEIISYNEMTGVFRFGLLGGGTFTISTQNISFPNITRESYDEVLTYDIRDGGVHFDTISVRARANGARVFGDGANTVNGDALSSIEFRNGTTNAGITYNAGALTVDLSEATQPPLPTIVEANATTNTLAGVVTAVVTLNTVTADTTFTLPTADDTQLGTVVRFFNISRYSSTGGNVDPARTVSSGVWSISPATGQRINGLAVNENLVLDNFRANFSLTWTGATRGWVITGTE